jgi:hypothetical protein
MSTRPLPAISVSLVQSEITPEYASRLARERACEAHPGGMHLAIIAADLLWPGNLTSAEVERSLRAVRKIVRNLKSRKTHDKLVNEYALMQREATGQSSWREIVDQAIDAQTILVLHEALHGLSVLGILDTAELGQFDILSRRIAERLVSVGRTARVHHAPLPPPHVRLPDDDEPTPAQPRPLPDTPPGQEHWAIERELRAALRQARFPWVRRYADLEPFPVPLPEAAARLGITPRHLRRLLGPATRAFFDPASASQVRTPERSARASPALPALARGRAPRGDRSAAC